MMFSNEVQTELRWRSVAAQKIENAMLSSGFPWVENPGEIVDYRYEPPILKLRESAKNEISIICGYLK